MEVALSSKHFLDRPSDTVFVNLPSWGDPILPQTWQHSEDDIRERFIWPRTDDSSDSEHDCVPMLMSDPLLDKDMTSLMMRGTSESEDQDQSEYDDTDQDSYLMCRDDDSFQFRGNGDESRSLLESSSASSSRSESRSSSMSSYSEEMDYETEEETRDPVAREPFPTKFEWAVEAYYKNNRLCFKLRTLGGAYMQLMADEVLESLQAILEDSMDSVLFRVQRMDGQVLLVDSTMIIPIISSILSIHPSVITPSTLEQREQPEVLEQQSEPPHRVNRAVLRAPILSKRKFKYVPERKQQSRIGFAWRAISGRSKNRSRPPTPVE